MKDCLVTILTYIPEVLITKIEFPGGSVVKTW